MDQGQHQQYSQKTSPPGNSEPLSIENEMSEMDKWLISMHRDTMSTMWKVLAKMAEKIEVEETKIKETKPDQ